jgi:hypothetical protein
MGSRLIHIYMYVNKNLQSGREREGSERKREEVQKEMDLARG